jgi:hypothetical protein
MNILKISTDNDIKGIEFPQYSKKIFEIGSIFEKTDGMYVKLLDELNLPRSFNFKNRDLKRFYTNEFIKCIVELLKSQTFSGEIFMYANSTTLIPLKISLIRQLKTLFGIRILDMDHSFEQFYENLKAGDCAAITAIELLFAMERKPKSFKGIKKYLTKHGYVFLNDVYFKEFTNKLAICI